LRREEDLWLELAFYPNRVRMRNIIRRIWKRPQLAANAAVLERLLSKRKTGYEATLAFGKLRAV